MRAQSVAAMWQSISKRELTGQLVATFPHMETKCLILSIRLTAEAAVVKRSVRITLEPIFGVSSVHVTAKARILALNQSPSLYSTKPRCPNRRPIHVAELARFTQKIFWHFCFALLRCFRQLSGEMPLGCGCLWLMMFSLRYGQLDSNSLVELPRRKMKQVDIPIDRARHARNKSELEIRNLSLADLASALDQSVEEFLPDPSRLDVSSK